jgi:hypothetical protein
MDESGILFAENRAHPQNPKSTYFSAIFEAI